MDPTDIAVHAVKAIQQAIEAEALDFGFVLDNPAFQAAVEYLHIYFEEHK